MRILVTNDDGIWARGIKALADEISKQHDIVVVAPGEERSGVGHGFTFLQPLICSCKREFAYPAFSLSGMPVDCVKLGAYKFFDGAPDALVSGVNRGANLGTDVLYSGTASAALEGAILGIPSLAVSCDSMDPEHYDSAAKYASKVLDYILDNPLPPYTMLNLNVPDLPYEQIRGMKLAELGAQHYTNHYEARIDPRGREYFWLSDEKKPCQDERYDEFWVKQGYASLTPVSANLTARDHIDKMRRQGVFE